jgi:hypothetical protein
MADREVLWPTGRDPILHVHGQGCPHDDVIVEGTPRALRRLANALRRAMTSGASIEDFFTNDGEGYSVCVVMLRADDEVRQAATPYSHEAFIYRGDDDPYKRALDLTERMRKRQAGERTGGRP